MTGDAPPGSYGPHCDHTRCAWLICDETQRVEIACKGQATCPMCGPVSSSWQRLAGAAYAALVEKYHTADPFELLAADMAPAVVDQAAMLAAHYKRGKWIVGLARQVAGASPKLQRAFLLDYIAVTSGREASSGRDWRGGLAGLGPETLTRLVVDVAAAAARVGEDLLVLLDRVGVGDRGRLVVDELVAAGRLACRGGRYHVLDAGSGG